MRSVDAARCLHPCVNHALEVPVCPSSSSTPYIHDIDPFEDAAVPRGHRATPRASTFSKLSSTRRGIVSFSFARRFVSRPLTGLSRSPCTYVYVRTRDTKPVFQTSSIR